MKPHWKTYALCLALVLTVTGLDLLRPVLIGSEAIDRYILGPYACGAAEVAVPQRSLKDVLHLE